MHFKNIPAFAALIFCLSLKAQDTTRVAKNDTLKLPFAISNEKKLSEEDLKNKKEGFYVTAIPDISSDPINGFGFGAEASLFFNEVEKYGNKTDDTYISTSPALVTIDASHFYTHKIQ